MSVGIRFISPVPIHCLLRPAFRPVGLVGQYDASQAYPPDNIERTDETHYRITLAVAGFAEKDLNVEVREGVLSVHGKRDEAERTDKTGYLDQGIAGRAFERRFQLAENVEVRAPSLRTDCCMSIWKLTVLEQNLARIQINAADLKVLEGKAKAA